MAEVFAGHAIGDHGFQKPVAVKRLLPELANDTVFVERLIGDDSLTRLVLLRGSEAARLGRVELGLGDR